MPLIDGQTPISIKPPEYS